MPILERGKANAILDNREWTQPIIWPDWTLIALDSKYIVIAEIVANLLENAFKYAAEGAAIGIAITSNGICIFDNGTKIKKIENEKIFQKGFRGLASKKKEGTGVGLFLAKKLAQQIGGDLILLENSLESLDEEIKNLPNNNLFYLKLPIKEFHL